jgi:uncharacterized membrane-anchored protein
MNSKQSTHHSDKNLWQLFQQNNLLSSDAQQQEVPKINNDEQSLWYIRAMQGFAGWIAALFILGFVGSVFGWLFRNDSASALITLGLAACGCAYVFFKTTKHSDFLQQLGLAFNLAGQLMVAFGLYELINPSWKDKNYIMYFFSLMSFQALLVFFINDFISRLLSSWFALIALFFMMNSAGVYGITTPIIISAFCLIWLQEKRYQQFNQYYLPIGFGLALALLQFETQRATGHDFNWFYDKTSLSFISLYAREIGSALVAISLTTIGFNTIKNSIQDKIDQLVKHDYFILILVVAFISVVIFILNYFIVGLIAGLVLLTIGFMVQRKELVALGALALVSFFCYYYYNLNLSLLTKSLILMKLGLVLLLVTAWLGYAAKTKKSNLAEESQTETKQTENKQSVKLSFIQSIQSLKQAKWVVCITVVFVLILTNLSIAKKEAILQDGTMVLLKLAPVDPRSLMQGDYMRLRFAIENQILSNETKQTHKAGVQKLIVDLDDNQVGQFSRLVDLSDPHGQKLEDTQVMLQYRLRSGRIYLTTHAFFFQEGTAKDYEAAEYGEFRVDENGEILLNALRDKSFNVIGLNRPSQ